MKNILKNLLCSLLGIFIFTGSALEAKALESEWAVADYVQARLLAVPLETEGNPYALQAALEVRLEEGWHAYWRMPGDGGLAPVLNWEESENLNNVTVGWPMPQRFEIMDLQSFGYEKNVLFPVIVTVQSLDKDVDLNLKANIMVCSDICVPQDLSLSLSVPVGGPVDSPYSALVERAQGQVPHKGDTKQLKLESLVLGPEAIVMRLYAQKGFDNVDVFIEAEPELITAKPEITLDEKDSRYASVRIAKPHDMESLVKDLSGQELIITISDGRNAIEREFSF